MSNHDENETYVEGEHLGVPTLLDALTDVIERARSMPMSSSVLVNRNEALKGSFAIDLLASLAEAAIELAGPDGKSITPPVNTPPPGAAGGPPIEAQAERTPGTATA